MALDTVYVIYLVEQSPCLDIILVSFGFSLPFCHNRLSVSVVFPSALKVVIRYEGLMVYLHSAEPRPGPQWWREGVTWQYHTIHFPLSYVRFPPGVNLFIDNRDAFLVSNSAIRISHLLRDHILYYKIAMFELLVFCRSTFSRTKGWTEANTSTAFLIKSRQPVTQDCKTGIVTRGRL